jgi:hypothetical protein
MARANLGIFDYFKKKTETDVQAAIIKKQETEV